MDENIIKAFEAFNSSLRELDLAVKELLLAAENTAITENEEQ